jgi:predicted dehydrogenase
MTAMTKRKVAIIGAGLQGGRRAPAVHEHPNFAIAVVVDRHLDRAEKLAKPFGATAETDWQKAVHRDDIEAVLVLTPPDSHAEITLASLEAGKHVLCEKPLAFSEEQGRAMIAAAKKHKRVLKCGFNHRHHPAVLAAHKLFTAGAIGKATFGRGRYGIAGREGLASEWRSDPKVAPGGQLMEQGVHLVDLFRWFVGDMTEVTGMMSTTVWPIAPLEDNGFLLMKNAAGVVCSVHASLTQWINLFELEVYGEKGSLRVEALGGGYGVEKLHFSEHDPNGPFSYKTTEYRGADASWKGEWAEFVRAIAENAEPLGSGVDGLKAMEVVNAAYAGARDGRAVRLAGA